MEPYFGVTGWSIAVLAVCIGVAAGLLGAGPSFLTLLLLVHVARLEPSVAVTTTLASVGMTSLVALVPYASRGDVMWRAGVAFGVASLSGAYLGGRVAAWIPEAVVATTFLLAMVGAAIAMLWKRPAAPNEDVRTTSSRRLGLMPVAGLLLGSLTGTLGLGGGFAVVPLLVAFYRAPMRAAVGTSLFVIAMNTLAGLAGHLTSHSPHLVEWRLGVEVGACASAGSVAGAWLGRRLDPTLLRRMFAVLMLATAVALLASDIVSLERGGRASL